MQIKMTHKELNDLTLTIFPESEVLTNETDEVVIYTGMKIGSDGILIPMGVRLVDGTLQEDQESGSKPTPVQDPMWDTKWWELPELS